MVDALPGNPREYSIAKSYDIIGNIANTTGFPS